MELSVFVFVLAAGLVWGVYLAGLAVWWLRTGRRGRPVSAAALVAGLLIAGGAAGVLWWGYQKFYVNVPQPTPSAPDEVYAGVFGEPPPAGVRVHVAEEQVFGPRTWRYVSFEATDDERLRLLEEFTPVTIGEYIDAFPMFDRSLDTPSIAPRGFVPHTSEADRFYRRDPEPAPGARTYLTEREDDGRVYVFQDVRP